jgi:hypothetical protein
MMAGHGEGVAIKSSTWSNSFFQFFIFWSSPEDFEISPQRNPKFFLQEISSGYLNGLHVFSPDHTQ